MCQLKPLKRISYRDSMQSATCKNTYGVLSHQVMVSDVFVLKQTGKQTNEELQCASEKRDPNIIDCNFKRINGF